MEFDRFSKIIKYNKKYQGQTMDHVRELFTKMGMNYEQDLLNIMQIVRPLFEKKKYIVLEIPFRDKEIGAICYKGDSFGYALINTSLPKVNVNFALCHEIYHIFFQNDSFYHRIELYMNNHYFEHEEEMFANLFAGVFLMPEVSFSNMFYKFSSETVNEDFSNKDIITLVKLMNYFEVPYMAALIRCYELDLLCSGEQLKHLLMVTPEEIKETFKLLWLDEEILQATRKDNYLQLERLVKQFGTKYQAEGIVSERSLTRVISNMQSLYEKVRG